MRRGDDPVAEVRTAKLSAAQTFEMLVGQFLAAMRPRYRLGSFKEIERHLTKHACDLNKRAAARITRQDIAAMLAAVAEKSGDVTGNRVRSSLSAFYSWLIENGHADLNPIIGTKKNEEQSRDRVLTPSELRLIWNALGDDDHGSIVKLLALTGQRESEIAGSASLRNSRRADRSRR